MDFISFLASTAAAAIDNATPTELALASLVGAVGLYTLVSSIYVTLALTLAGGIGYAFWVLPSTTFFYSLILTIVVIMVYIMYAAWVFSQWEEAFSGHRLQRGAEACPSNQQLPDIKR